MTNAILTYSIVSFLVLFLFSKISYKLNLLDFEIKEKTFQTNSFYWWINNKFCICIFNFIIQR